MITQKVLSYKCLFFCFLTGLLLCIVSSCRTYTIIEKDFQEKFAVPDTLSRVSFIDSIRVFDRKGKEMKMHPDSSWKVEIQWEKRSIAANLKRNLFEVSDLSFYDSSIWFNTTINGNHLRGNYSNAIPIEQVQSLVLKKIPGTDSRCWLKIAPLPLADPYGGNSFRGGVEGKVYRNIALSAEAGSFIPNGLAGISNVRGVILQPELKVYLNRNGRTVGDYMSIAYFYKNNRFDMTDSIYGTPDYETTYRIKRKAQALLLKWGRQYVHGDHFVFDFSFGGGVRQVSGSSDLSEVQEGHIMSGEGHGGIIYSLVRSTGSYYAPQVIVGFKLGWKIF